MFQQVSSKSHQPLLIAIAMAIVSVIPLSHAQVLEEIIVTAQKREQLLQDVGISVTAFTGEQIEALGFEDSADIAAASHGVHIASSSGGHLQQFTIRGVTQNDFFDAVEAPVAVYIDEGYIAMQQGQSFGLFDLDRVEILKGPQGTLFGRNATGGLVHFITKKPTFNETEGFIDLTYGSYDQIGVEAAMGGPLSENLAGRAAMFYRSNGDFVENLFPLGAVNTGSVPAGGGADLGGEDSWGIRGHALFKASEDVELLLSVYATESNYSESPYESRASIAEFDAQGRHINSFVASSTETREAFGPGGVPVPLVFVDAELPVFPLFNEDGVRPVAGGDLFGFRDSDLGDFKTSHEFAFDEIDEHKSYGVTGKLTWELLDNVTVTSVTSFKSYEKFQALDIGAAPSDQSVFMTEAETDSVTQELHLNWETDRARLVAGFYFLTIDNETNNGQMFPASSVLTPIAVNPAAFSTFQEFLAVQLQVVGTGLDQVGESQLETDSYSLFAQVDYDLTDELTLIAGLRVVQEEKEYMHSLNAYLNIDDKTIDTTTFLFPIRVPPADAMVGETFTNPFVGDSSETLWTGKIQLDWRPSEDWLVYAGVNRGVKAGSFNATLPLGDRTPTDEIIPYGEEVLLAYEIGFKSTLFDGTTRFNASLFYYDYNDYQAFRFTGVAGLVENRDSTVKGIEFNFITSPAKGWDFLLNAAFFDAEVDGVEVAAGVFRDVEPTFAPDTQLSGLIRYAWPALGGELAVQLDANYSSSFWSNIKNFDSQRMPNYVVGNARFSWESRDQRWKGTFFINNLADSEYVTDQFNLATFCGCDEVLFGRPRWFGGSLRYSF